MFIINSSISININIFPIVTSHFCFMSRDEENNSDLRGKMYYLFQLNYLFPSCVIPNKNCPFYLASIPYVLLPDTSIFSFFSCLDLQSSGIICLEFYFSCSSGWDP